MNVLNPHLYRQLQYTFPRVRISNDGASLQLTYAPDWVHRQGRLRALVRDYGETYYVSCPFCSDTRQRLAINHRWGERDATTGDNMLCLAKCFNEDCLNTRERQKQLHAMVFPKGRYAEQVEIIPAKPIKPLVAAVTAPIMLPDSVPLDRLHRDHPARRYILGRGLNPDTLSRDYSVRYCDQCLTCHPPLREPRIIIPIYQPALSTGYGDARGLRLAGWQARLMRATTPGDTPKYLTATGTKKNQILYNLPQACKTKGPVVIVEGIFDALKAGPNAVALLGKTISPAQRQLILRHFPKRPVVIWLDPDALAQAQFTSELIRRDRIATGDRTPVVLAATPAGRQDPGDCRPEEAQAAIRRALAGRKSTQRRTRRSSQPH